MNIGLIINCMLWVVILFQWIVIRAYKKQAYEIHGITSELKTALKELNDDIDKYADLEKESKKDEEREE